VFQDVVFREGLADAQTKYRRPDTATGQRQTGQVAAWVRIPFIFIIYTVIADFRCLAALNNLR